MYFMKQLEMVVILISLPNEIKSWSFVLVSNIFWNLTFYEIMSLGVFIS
jgi:hypothetical protein